VLDGGFYWVLFYYGGYFVSWVFVGGFLLYLGFHVGFGCCGYAVSYGFFMWASWVAHVYLGAPYTFLMKFSYLSKKNITRLTCLTIALRVGFMVRTCLIRINRRRLF
jgi:hypothetical protein